MPKACSEDRQEQVEDVVHLLPVLLAEAFATGKDPAEDKFVSTYLFTRLELSIAEGVSAELPIDRDAVGLALAELRQNEEISTARSMSWSSWSRHPTPPSRSLSCTPKPAAGTT